jgi:hypothetical protein
MGVEHEMPQQGNNEEGCGGDNNNNNNNNMNNDDDSSSDNSVIMRPTPNTPNSNTHSNTHSSSMDKRQQFNSDRLGSTRSLIAVNQAAFVRYEEYIYIYIYILFHLWGLLYSQFFSNKIKTNVFVLISCFLLYRYVATMRKLQCHKVNELRSK